MNEPTPTTPYWFHAKRVGYGWGLPARREGWIVSVLWLLAVVAGAVLLGRHTIAFVAFMAVTTAMIIGVCYAKGEPPKWRS